LATVPQEVTTGSSTTPMPWHSCLVVGELALKEVFSVGFPASLFGGFPCALGPENGRKFTGPP
jgi:hypothetical protein